MRMARNYIRWISKCFIESTYLVTSLDSGALPNEDVVAKATQDVAIIELVDIGRHVISLRQVEVDVLLGHSLVHSPYFLKIQFIF